jgi:protein TonB
MSVALMSPEAPGPLADAQAALLVPGRHRRRQAQAARWQAMAWRLLAVALVLGAAWWARQHLIHDPSHPRGAVQRVALVSAPKPPPPKVQEKPPEVEVQKQDVEVATQAKSPDQPDNQLGVDADGEGAGDGFGLMGKRGGQDITTLGASSGDGQGAGISSGVQRFNFGVYAGMVRQRLQNELAQHAELREERYVSIVLLWINERGRVERVELQQGSGFGAVDLLLRKAFNEMPVLPEPPQGLPQPLRLRVTSADLKLGR